MTGKANRLINEWQQKYGDIPEGATHIDISWRNAAEIDIKKLENNKVFFWSGIRKRWLPSKRPAEQLKDNRYFHEL